MSSLGVAREERTLDVIFKVLRGFLNPDKSYRWLSRSASDNKYVWLTTAHFAREYLTEAKIVSRKTKEGVDNEKKSW